MGSGRPRRFVAVAGAYACLCGGGPFRVLADPLPSTNHAQPTTGQPVTRPTTTTVPPAFPSRPTTFTSPTDSRLHVDRAKLPPSWSQLGCSSNDHDEAGAWAVIGRPGGAGRWTQLIVVLVASGPSDREVGASEASGITMVDVGPGRPLARSQSTPVGASVDWWEEGVRVAVVGTTGDGAAVLRTAQKTKIVRSSTRLSLRTTPPAGRVELARVAVSSTASLECLAAPGMPTLTLDTGDGLPGSGPPPVAGDELRRTTVRGHRAWLVSRHTRMGAGGRPIDVTTCVLTWEARAAVRATMIGPGPCDGLLTAANDLAPALA